MHVDSKVLKVWKLERKNILDLRGSKRTIVQGWKWITIETKTSLKRTNRKLHLKKNVKPGVV